MPTGETLGRAWIRLQCADLKLFELEDDFSRWDSDSWTEVDNLLKGDEGGKKSSAYYKWFVKSALTNQERVIVSFTDSFRLGICSKLVRVGDKVVLLLGGEFPIIPRPDGEVKYTFVYEVYVHSFIDGEGLIEA
jgi:hypothetical protein